MFDYDFTYVSALTFLRYNPCIDTEGSPVPYNKKAVAKYFSSQKGQAAKRRADSSYDKSEAGIARRKRYRQNQSEEQKEKQRQRMRDYRARKKQERALALTSSPAPSLAH